MIKRMSFLIALVIALAMAGTAWAQGPIGPQHSDPGWQAMYWNNTGLSGPPVLQRAEGNLDYDWGTGSPAPGVNADQFSARWTRYIDVTPGTYRFTVTADDGIRLWVDNGLLIDQWRDQSPTTFSASKYLGPGHHLVRVEYYENFGGAVARVSWTLGGTPPPPPPPPTPPPGYGNWRGEYFNNKSLSGTPALVHNETQIRFNWGTGSPAPGWVDTDGFSVRWSRSLNLPAGNYRFTMTVDDGARLFVNGHTLIDAWKDQSATTYTGDIYLPGGTTTIQMEYYENVGAAVAQLAWTSGPQPPPPPPPTGHIGYVSTHQLNVRSGPGLNYRVVGSLRQGQPVRLLGRNWQTTWLKIDRGWVYAAYIRTNMRLADLPVVR
jgi:hypothetical protein